MENPAEGQGNGHQRDRAKGRLIVPRGVMQRLGCESGWSSCFVSGIGDRNGPHCAKAGMSRGLELIPGKHFKGHYIL